MTPYDVASWTRVMLGCKALHRLPHGQVCGDCAIAWVRAEINAEREARIRDVKAAARRWLAVVPISGGGFTLRSFAGETPVSLGAASRESAVTAKRALLLGVIDAIVDRSVTR